MDYSDFPLHSWSLRKEAMMKRCPRAALFHYALSRGGGDPAASRECRELHAMRSLISRQGFCRHLLGETIRELFYQTPDDSPLALRENAMRRLSREFSAMATGEYLRFGTPLLRELLDSGPSAAPLFREVEKDLLHMISLITQRSWERLLLVPMESRRFIDSPLRVQINDLPCFCAPLLAWEEKGDLWILQLGAPDDAAAVLYRFHALNVLGVPPERLRCFTLSPETGEIAEFGLFSDISAELRRIEQGAARWKELTGSSWQSLPRREEFCGSCDFRRRCCESGFPGQKSGSVNDTINKIGE